MKHSTGYEHVRFMALNMADSDGDKDTVEGEVSIYLVKRLVDKTITHKEYRALLDECGYDGSPVKRMMNVNTILEEIEEKFGSSDEGCEVTGIDGEKVWFSPKAVYEFIVALYQKETEGQGNV